MLTFSGPVLPDGEAREFCVVDGRISYDVVAGAEVGASGWIVPGLVDAHCHVGLDQDGAVDEATQEEQATTDRDAGALLLRDCGSAADTAWIHDREDLPRLGTSPAPSATSATTRTRSSRPSWRRTSLRRRSAVTAG
jgi:hypothetical protein